MSEDIVLICQWRPLTPGVLHSFARAFYKYLYEYLYKRYVSGRRDIIYIHVCASLDEEASVAR